MAVVDWPHFTYCHLTPNFTNSQNFQCMLPVAMADMLCKGEGNMMYSVCSNRLTHPGSNEGEV